jgi:cyclophilin family peptidyl-prolyl cis-trans isomerase
MSATPIPNQVLASGATSLNLDLSSYFSTDGITGSLVKLTTNSKGKANALFVELFDAPNPAAARTTPLTAANFLGYVNNGAYNGTVFHRLVPGFVLQGGGFRMPSAADTPPSPIAQGPTVPNEPGNSNLPGTVAMAKLGTDPNSATNQFFFNLANNAANLDQQNGGFTVFGRLVGSSLALLDRLAATPDFNFGGVFSNLPLQRYKPAKPGASPRPVLPANFLAITTAEQSGAFSFKVKAKGATASIDPISGALDLRWSTPPSKTTSVGVQATSLINPKERYRTSFQVLPALLSESQPLAFAPAASSDPLVGLVALTDLLAA